MGSIPLTGSLIIRDLQQETAKPALSKLKKYS
jgi:hypothetical protein